MKYLYLLLILVLVPLVSAVPEIPHQFYGSVSNSYDLVSLGTVTANLCNKEFSVPIVEGYYGLSEPLLVVREDCSGTTIEFFVDGDKVDDYTYVPGGYTELNLNVPVPDTQDTLDTGDTGDSSDAQTNDGDDNGEPRDTSHIRPPPDDLVFDDKQAGQDSVQDTNGVQSGGITGKAVYEFFTKSKPGIITSSLVVFVGFLGLIHLLVKFSIL